MRSPATAERVTRFMERLGTAVRSEGRVYLNGGASALLIGWRNSTIDIDLHPDPEPLGFFEALPALKDGLDLNIELAAPFHFIPELPDWRARSIFIARYGKIDFYHFDFYSQALSKLERAYDRDLRDVEQMTSRGLIQPDQMARLFSEIRPRLIRFPSLDETRFAANIERYREDHRA